MPLNWENRNYPHYSFPRDRSQHPIEYFNSGKTTAQSLMQILQQTPTCRSYCREKDFRNEYVKALYIDCDEVYPNIFIGDGTTAKHKDFLKKVGITHVLNTAEGKAVGMVNTNAHFYNDVGIKYMGFQLLDHPSVKISEYFHVAADFIQKAINSGGIVYVHCLMGKSRSSTCVLAYLMIKVGMSAAEALKTVKEKRAIYPNEGFLQQLADLDNFIKNRRYESGWYY